MLSLPVLTAVIAGLLVLISVTQPAAERLHLPYTVLLAVVGVALGGFASVVLYMPLTQAFSDIADLTAHVSARAQDLEAKVSTFFNRVRAA